jgi:hypothetical protein
MLNEGALCLFTMFILCKDKKKKVQAKEKYFLALPSRQASQRELLLPR